MRQKAGGKPPAVLVGWRPGMCVITARYRELLRKLEAAVKDVDGGGDRLTGALYSLVAIMDFLDADPAVAATTNTKLLGVLAHSLRDVQEGGKPALIFARERKSGRPRDRSFAAVQGNVAAMLTMLIDAGETRQAAGRFLALALAQNRVRHPNGHAITAIQALRWRDEIGGRLPGLATATYQDILNRYRENAPPGLLADLRACRNIVAGAVRGIVSQGF